MNQDSKNDMEQKRISLDYRKIKIDNSNFEPFPNLLKYWLLEDFRHGILPYKLKHSKEFNCYLVPEIMQFEKILINNLNIHGKKFNLDDTIYHFIENIAVDLINYGQCIIESVFDVQYNYFELYDISDCDVGINSKNIIQKIPKIVQKEKYSHNRIKILRSNCLAIEFPDTIGGKKKYLKLLEKFSQPDPLLKQHEYVIRQAQGEQLNYDFIEHNRMIDLKQWRESNFISWNHRQHPFSQRENLFTNHFLMDRKLRFKKTQIILRDYIIQNIKEFINRLSKKFNMDCNIEIKGLKPLEYYEEGIKKWCEGTIDYMEAWKYINE